MLHTSYHISELAKIVKGKPAAGKFSDALIEDILIDSRKLISPEACIFFALTSKRNDGHQYIGDLYEKGIRNFVISAVPDDMASFSEANFALVDNTLSALQALTEEHRKKFDIPVVGITGSNGKTIVKEWLYQILGKKQQLIRSPKSYNSQIGVPLSVWQLDPKYELAIFEAGISEPDEMEKLQAIIKPTIGLFTNIGQAHDENFISTQQKVGEKLKLFTRVDTLVYCPDHSAIQEVIIRSELLKSIKAFTWSWKQEADIRITKAGRKDKNTTIQALYEGRDIAITIPFTDKASIENAIHCWALMLHMGYVHEDIAPGFQTLQPIAMRLELKGGINHCIIINDSYNSDINSLSIAIDFLQQQASQKSKSIILSDILQSGKDEDELYSDIAEIIHNKGIDRIIGIGPAINRQSNKFHIDKKFYLSTDDFLRNFPFTQFNNEVILLKGARVFEFEQISKALQQKTHETTLEINLNALINNLNYFRSLLKPDTKIMAMVKAFSYGSGSYEIANALQFHRVDYLAVAYADEGVELRRAGIQTPIMVMSPDEQSFDAIIKYNLEPEIYNFRILSLLERAIKKNILPRNKPVKIHLKLDTGMHRLGFCDYEIDDLVQRVMGNRQIYTQSIFSHLAASEDPSLDEFTGEQIARFNHLSHKIIDRLDHEVLKHILNSAGITRHPDAQFDIVRLGIGLYGVAGTPENEGKLENVSTLKSVISQVKKMMPGDTVGYNRNFKAEREMKIAVVPIGYADGLNRRLGNGRGSLIIRGKMAPLIGNICMDMCMVDITDIDASEGDEVIVFGDHHRIEDIAEAMGTIPYEVLAGISGRVKRVYYHE